MITIAASELDFYQKKITRLEMELIVLHEELALANTKTPDNLKEKYDLLLVQVSGEKEAWDKKYGEEKEKQEKSVVELNTRWETMLQERTTEFRHQIETLTEEKSTIKNRLVEMEMKNLKLQREIDEGDTEILQIKLDSFKKENERLKVQINEAYQECEQQIAEMRRHLEIKIEETKEREKSFYRDQIEALEKVVEDLQAVLASEREKISPEREELIGKLQKELANQKKEQDTQLQKLASLLEKRNKQFSIYREQSQKKEAHNLENIKDLTSQLKSLQHRIFQSGFEKDIQLSQLQKEMSQKRQREADDLKRELERVQCEFSNERNQWKSILSQFEEENKQIKFKWEEEKKKYLEEKNRLKLKITELKVRLKEREETNGNGETELLIKSLKELNNNQEQFSSYENAITFMDRQIKKAAIKISEKDRQINTLLEELTSLQSQTEHQIEYTKEKSRQQQKKLYDKIFQLEEQLDQVQDQLREKEKYIKKKESDLNEEKEGREIEISNLKKIIEEMERDYTRLTSNKKSLEDSYREERENVITSKVDINQERKKKWQDLERQRNQLEIVYREREQQIKKTAEVDMDKLKREKQRAIEQKEQLRAQVESLRQRLNIPHEENKQNKYVQYQKKLATLDLEISLTQNLFKTLSSATARASHKKKTQYDDMSEGESAPLSEQQSFQMRASGMITPPFGSVDYQKDEPYKNAAFSFFPGQQNRK